MHDTRSMAGAYEPPRVVVLSGPVGAGKSTLGRNLAQRFGLNYLRTQDLMRQVAAERGDSLPSERRAMQSYGEALDSETRGEWVAAEIARLVADGDVGGGLIVVDAVRIMAQIDALRSAFPSKVTHIHVHAPAEALAQRYVSRDSGLVEFETYDEMAANPTEAKVSALAGDADVSIDTERSSEQDVLARAVAALGLSASRSARLVDVVIGGQYGSEGKGNVAFHIASEYDVLMRVGGPNAGHMVPTEPSPYTHRLLPSGTLANPSALLLIGPGATLDLTVLLAEIADCGVEAGRLFIDPLAMIIEHEDRVAEKQMKKDIGSTGKGGGAAAARRIMGRSTTVKPAVRMARDVQELAAFVKPVTDVLESSFRAGKLVLLEGTQGTLLSIFHGFYPWVTSRDTTTAACLSEAGIGPHRLRRVLMVVRTYPIRVGNPPESSSGRMSQEVDWDVIAQRSGLDETKLRSNEKGSVSGSKRRVAEFDWELLRRAAELNGATDIALTFADYLDARNGNARRFDQLTTETIHFVDEIERVGGAPVSLIFTGFDSRSMIDRREW